MAQFRGCEDADRPAAFGPRWADAVGRGDVFDATSGWMRGHVADLCNLRCLPEHSGDGRDGNDLLGGLMRRLLGRLRNG
ncbi:MAG: hypothetical protein U1E53_27430 [Dongiaceae bacterium]